MGFSDNFTFSRPTSATWRDALGVAHVAAPDVPRFDWLNGAAAGLLIESSPLLGQADQVGLRAGVMAGAGVDDGVKSTVLHVWQPPGGAIRREAHYATFTGAMIDGCLARVGHHAWIGVVAGHLRNWGGWVWAEGMRWQLPGMLDAGGDVIGTADGRPLIGL